MKKIPNGKNCQDTSFIIVKKENPYAIDGRNSYFRTCLNPLGFIFCHECLYKDGGPGSPWRRE